MAVHPRGAFDLPVGGGLLFKTAFVTDPVLYFPPLVLAGGDAEYLFAAIPERYFSLAIRVGAIPMRVYGFQEPNAVLEAEGPVRQRPHRAHVDDIADKVMVQGLLYIGGDLGMVSAVEDAVFSFIR